MYAKLFADVCKFNSESILSYCDTSGEYLFFPHPQMSKPLTKVGIKFGARFGWRNSSGPFSLRSPSVPEVRDGVVGTSETKVPPQRACPH